MPEFESYLKGNDLRSIAGVEDLLPLIKTQADFDALFRYLFTGDRLLVMRAVDAVEKITRSTPQYLAEHASELLDLLAAAHDIELKWHLALLLPRISLEPSELDIVWNTLAGWAQDTAESRIVRVNSLQALHEITTRRPELRNACLAIFQAVEGESVPSIKARLRKLKIDE